MTSLPGWCSELCIQVRGYGRKISQLITSFFWARILGTSYACTLLQSPFLTSISDAGEVDLTAYFKLPLFFYHKPTEHSLIHLNTKLPVTAPLSDLPVGPRCASKWRQWKTLGKLSWTCASLELLKAKWGLCSFSKSGLKSKSFKYENTHFGKLRG